MKIIVALLFATGLLVAPVTSGSALAKVPDTAFAKHPCTKTSSGTCIQGGEFCPQSKYGQYGWDAAGRRYKCRGDHEHPHWYKA
jgi:hypothetical protein